MKNEGMAEVWGSSSGRLFLRRQVLPRQRQYRIARRLVDRRSSVRDLVAPVRPPFDFPNLFESLCFGHYRNKLSISADMPESEQI
jgi:hypothetical protein